MQISHSISQLRYNGVIELMRSRILMFLPAIASKEVFVCKSTISDGGLKNHISLLISRKLRNSE